MAFEFLGNVETSFHKGANCFSSSFVYVLVSIYIICQMIFHEHPINWTELNRIVFVLFFPYKYLASKIIYFCFLKIKMIENIQCFLFEKALFYVVSGLLTFVCPGTKIIIVTKFEWNFLSQMHHSKCNIWQFGYFNCCSVCLQQHSVYSCCKDYSRIYKYKHKYNKYVIGNNKINAWKQDANRSRVNVVFLHVYNMNCNPFPLLLLRLQLLLLLFFISFSLFPLFSQYASQWHYAFHTFTVCYLMVCFVGNKFHTQSNFLTVVQRCFFMFVSGLSTYTSKCFFLLDDCPNLKTGDKLSFSKNA